MTTTFRDLGVAHELCDALEAQGITHPFPIQELALPLALKGNDLIGQARTGTGKTLAFGLPLLQRLDPSERHTQALVVVPTRELCLQVYADLQIGDRLDITSIAVYGGVGYDEQIDALTGGAHVVVGTPGRLLDHLDRRNLDLSKVTQLVLDEADEMLDMGFLPDVERLIEACTGSERHTMLFSATMPTAIVKLARRYMDQPTFTRAEQHQVDTAPTVKQHFFKVHRMDKPRVLARILQDRARQGVFVFVRTKHMADRLVRELEELSTPAIAIHGDLRQTTRERNMERFRSGKANVLVATEVAARGLDVSGVTHVINYDCPEDDKMYLHRIGRTARAGQDGVAVTFAEHNEADRLNVIRKAVGAGADEVVDIFSTSDELARRFDLPDETPWSHLSRASGTRADGGSNGRGAARNDRSGRSRQSAASGSRTATTSRARSGSSSRGSSGTSRTDASSPGSSSRAPSETSRTDASSPGSSSRAPSRDTADGKGHARSRSRARTRDHAASTGDAKSTPRDDKTSTGDAKSAPRDDKTSTGDAKSAPRDDKTSTGDVKTSTGDAKAPVGESKDASATSGSGRNRARRGRGGSRSSSGAQNRQSESGKQANGRQRTDDRSKAGRSTDLSSGGARDDSSHAGTGGQRGGRARQRSSGGERPSGGERSSGGEQPAGDAHGQPARGDGQPSNARQVKVEHLP